MPYTLSAIHKLLLKTKTTLSIAESCTGGLLAKLLTDSPGSSRYFAAGIVAYSNQAKEVLLKIPRATIAKKGAVSPEVARGMARSCRKIMQTDIGIGITGIAGPKGATPGKPAGTVFIAIDTKYNSTCREFRFSGNRATVRKKSAQKALELLKSVLLA